MIVPPDCVPMLDVSSAQGEDIDWAEVRASGVERVVVECGIGNDAPNSLRAMQVAGAKAAGIGVQLYDFGYALPADGIHPNRDPIDQAQLFFTEAAELQCTDLPTILDLEFPKLLAMQQWHENAAGVRAWALACLAELERLTGITPWLYASKGYLTGIGCDQDESFAKYPLWMAAWADVAPAVPAPWTEWTAWQRSNKGIVSGIQSAVDLSWVRKTA